MGGTANNASSLSATWFPSEFGSLTVVFKLVMDLGCRVKDVRSNIGSLVVRMVSSVRGVHGGQRARRESRTTMEKGERRWAERRGDVVQTSESKSQGTFIVWGMQYEAFWTEREIFYGPSIHPWPLKPPGHSHPPGHISHPSLTLNLTSPATARSLNCTPSHRCLPNSAHRLATPCAQERPPPSRKVQARPKPVMARDVCPLFRFQKERRVTVTRCFIPIEPL